MKNEKISTYQHITAFDNKDGDITAKMQADKELDTSVLGEQVIHYSVTDSSGNKTVSKKIFTIIEKNEAAPVEITEPNVTNKTETSNSQSNPAAVVSDDSSSVTGQVAQVPVTEKTPTPMTITITMNGQSISYQNGGQANGQVIIDSHPNELASTWGGSEAQSSTDGLNTHFIGHNPGAFSVTFSLNIGSQIVVTDSTGLSTNYIVNTIIHVDDYGVELGTGKDYWELITGSSGGERITLQSCIDDSTNLIVIAYK